MRKPTIVAATDTSSLFQSDIGFFKIHYLARRITYLVLAKTDSKKVDFLPDFLF